MRPVPHAVPPQELPCSAPVPAHWGAAAPVPKVRLGVHRTAQIERAHEESPQPGGGQGGGGQDRAAKAELAGGADHLRKA